MAIESFKQKDNIGNETSVLKSSLRRTMYGSFHINMIRIISNLFMLANLDYLFQ